MREETNWENIQGYLPSGWEAAAKECGALQRGRNVSNAGDLLAVIMTYITEIGSHQGTSSLLRLTAGISLNKNAVRYRLQKSWPWLRWMSEAPCREEGFTMPRPDWLAKRRVLLVDASDIALVGGSMSEYRLHFVFDLLGFRYEGMEITSIKEGESLSRHKVSQGDIIVADRGYGSIRGMEHVRVCGGEFLLRIRSNAFHVYTEQGERIDLQKALSGLGALEQASIACYYRTKQGVLRPIRIVAMRKEPEAEVKALRRMERRASRCQRPLAQPQTVALASYILLATNLEETTERILELYRARWQIEQVFYRLKGLFNFGGVPGTNPDSVKAWFYGKLLLAVLCEKIALSRPFSPDTDRD